MSKYVVQISKESEEAYQILDKTARAQVSAEVTAREAAIAAEAEEREKGVTPKQQIDSGTDINNIKQSGIYTVTSNDIAASLINWPSAYRGELMVFNAMGNDQITYGTTQIVVANSSEAGKSDMYYRRLVSAGTDWLPWQRVVTKIQFDELDTKAIKSKTNIDSGSDIDTIKTNGIYTVTSNDIAVSLTNWPSAYRGELMVFNAMGNNQITYGVTQIAVTNSSRAGKSDIYYRRLVSEETGWYPWERAITEFEFNKAVTSKERIEANTDINTIKTNGIYTVTSNDIAASLINWPSAYRGELMVFNARGNEDTSFGVSQIAICNSAISGKAYMYYRRLVSAGTGWLDWYRIEVVGSSPDRDKNKGLILPLNPYKAIATKTDNSTGKKTWSDKIKDIKSTTHLHFSTADHFRKLIAKGYEHIAVSNYHASAPTVPMETILPTLSGYDPTTDIIPNYFVESPNAEHVYFTGESSHLHMNSIGSYVMSGSDNTSAGTGGFDGSVDEFFELAINNLKYANGGGVSINHPAWSELSSEDIISLYDKGAVFGMEIYNAGCEYQNQTGYALDLWDAVLSTGRQIFGLAVPDHSAEGSFLPDWETWPWGYNHLLCRTSNEEEILMAYRNGRYYTTIDNDTLALTYFGVENNIATIRVSEPGNITFKTKTRTQTFRNVLEATLTLASEDTYVRASVETETNKLFTNAIFM